MALAWLYVTCAPKGGTATDISPNFPSALPTQMNADLFIWTTWKWIGSVKNMCVAWCIKNLGSVAVDASVIFGVVWYREK